MQTDFRVKSGMKLYEQVLTQIRELIAQGVYQKGDLLPSEKELTDMMGVSRITVREGLRLLNEAGIIETCRGKGSFVRIDGSELLQNRLEGADYRESFLQATDARILLEPSVAAAAAELADVHVVEALERCFAVGQPASAFHAALIAVIDNPVISKWFADTVELEAGPVMSRMIPPVRQKSVSGELEQQHRKIFEAIRDGRPDDAYRCMREHLEHVRKIYVEYFHAFFA